MQETEATTMVSERERREVVAECRSRSMSSLTADDFARYTSAVG